MQMAAGGILEELRLEKQMSSFTYYFLLCTTGVQLLKFLVPSYIETIMGNLFLRKVHNGKKHHVT